MYHEKEGKSVKTEKKKPQSIQLTTIVTDEVTVSSPVSGGFSVTGDASSESALSIKNSTYCHYYISIDSTRIYEFWEGSCQRLPKNLSIEISID